MDLGIAGKWALVCGASKGLGWGCAQALAAEGVHVLMVARGEPALAEAASKIRAACTGKSGASVDFIAQDITTPEGRAAVLARRADFDIVVTNAGGPPPGDFRDWDRAAWLKAVEANMLTPIELMRATVDGMAARGFGRIVNITSSAVKAPIDILGLSNGARSGLTGFVAGLARNPQIAARGVTINNLLPGKFDTDRLAATFAGAARKTGQTVDEVRAAQQAQIPARRFGTAAEFGAICAFLCSVQAGYITGQNILADGGSYPGTF
ncbi:MAG: SDR family oxidoreductase [Pseudomonadota bacterium]|nr:SDR family oxidoreductase [Pseudomonadota bacterium]